MRAALESPAYADGGRHQLPIARSRPPRLAAGGDLGARVPDRFRNAPRGAVEGRLCLQVQGTGFSGTLVGINRPADPARFYFPSVGVAGAVTAVLDFKPAVSGSKTPRKAVLSLHDPTLREAVRIAGATRPLAADFTAPLAYYPHLPFLGLMEAIRVDRYFSHRGFDDVAAL